MKQIFYAKIFISLRDITLSEITDEARDEVGLSQDSHTVHAVSYVRRTDVRDNAIKVYV
jgi:hypothetical protein